MSDATLARLLRGLVVVGVVGALTGLTALTVTNQPSADLALLLIGIAGLAASFGAVAWIAARPQPRNPIVWIMASFALAVGIYAASRTVMAAIAPDILLPLDNESQAPADLPAAVAWIEGWTNAIASVATFTLLTFGLLLFPNGRLPSRRWRPVAAVLALGIVMTAISNVLVWRPENTVAPFAPDGPGHDFVLGNMFILLGPLAALAGLIIRFRRSDPTVRSQIKWITWGGVILVPATLLGSVTASPLFSLGGGLAFVAAYGVAITKHRLYDIDVVISRTLVFGALAVFIGVVYVGVVVGVGALIGSADEPNTGLAIAATAMVAVAFQPARRRLERLANRVVYGRKATPYEVLSEFSQRVAATSDTPFDEAARSLAEGTRAERVVISIRVDSEVIEAAASPETRSDAPSEFVSLPIEDAGAVLGSLDLYLPPGQPLQQDDRRLAEQVASAMGLALRNQVLTERLEARVEELRESRRRLVAVQDETRRRLERDLHDGAQQQLVALKVKLGLAKAIAQRDGAAGTAQALQRLSADADGAVEAMREFARGVYPPLLEAEGLSSAISAHARRVPIPVTVDSDGIGRYSRQVESTIYFCVIEALENVTRYSDAASATVALSQHNGTVAFTVHDDGRGFDPNSLTRGSGLTNMEDRLDASGGDLRLTAAPGQGTTVSGRVPAVALEESSS